jgi:HEAT repeat protein
MCRYSALIRDERGPTSALVPDDDANAPTLPSPSSAQDDSPDKLLRSHLPYERELGVAWLGRRGTHSAVEVLAPFLFDADVGVLHETAKALAQIGTADAISHLLRVARDERVAMTRRVVAVFALGGSKSTTDDMVHVLRELMRHVDPWLARTAQESLVAMVR